MEEEYFILLELEVKKLNIKDENWKTTNNILQKIEQNIVSNYREFFKTIKVY